MRQRLAVAGTLVGLAAIVVLVVLILQLGRHHPSPPSLSKHPNLAIPGELLWFDRNGCLVRGSASGARRAEVACVSAPSGATAWLDDGGVGYVRFGPAGPLLVRVNTVTREETEVATLPSPYPLGSAIGPENARGESVEVRGRGEVWVTSGGRRERIHKFDVSRSSGARPVSWSPDSLWIVLEYYHPGDDGGELWLLSRDGSVAGTLATQVRGGWAPSWRIEGVGVSPPLPAAK